MAGKVFLRYREVFTSQSVIVINHNLDSSFLTYRLLVNNTNRSDLISSVRINSSNQATITLSSSITGEIQVLETDTVPTGRMVTVSDDVVEGSTNLFYTEARVSANTDVSANTLSRNQSKVSANDTTEGFLVSKIVPGSNITITETGDGGNETLVIDTNFGTGSDESVKVSSNDTTSGFLVDKTAAGTGITLNQLNDGGNEDLQISANNTSNIWNANQIQSIPVNTTGITDDDYLIYNSASAQFETRQAGSGIAGITRFIPATNKFSFGNYGCQKIASNGSDTFNFIIPNQFVSVNSVKLIYFSDSTIAAGRTADISSSYGALTENITANNESNTIPMPTGAANIHRELDVSSVFTNLGPNDVCGLLVDLNNIGSTIYIIGISINYNS